MPLAALPLDPAIGRSVLAAARDFGCSEEMLIIAGMLSVPSVWSHAAGEKRALEGAKAKFAVAEGDLATYLNVHKAWVANGRSHKW